MEIKSYTEKYETAVIDLWVECGLVKPWNNPRQDIERKLKVDRDLFLIGLIDGKVVASVMGGYEGHRGWINYLAVRPKFQRKGYARTIMAAVERNIKSKGCPKINLQVRTTNTGVIAFYEALGYGDDNVIGMGKRLVEDKPYDGNSDKS